MRSVHVFLVLAIAVVGIAYLVFSSTRRLPDSVEVADSQEGDPAGELDVGEPIAWENLTIFPVLSKSPREADRFITLDEGLKAGTVEILERGAMLGDHSVPAADPFAAPAAEQGADEESSSAANDPLGAPAEQPEADAPNSPAANPNEPVQQLESVELPRANAVNELLVVNRSEKPLYLMPGEIIIGGDQDRAIAEEVVIAPGGEPTATRVYCVEHGRWSARDAATYVRLAAVALNSDSRTTGGHLEEDNVLAGYEANLSVEVDATQLAEEAQSGKFVRSIGSLNRPARMAVQSGEGQGKVWDEVALQNAKSEVREATGTFAGNYADAESMERLAPFLKQLQAPVSEVPNVVGVIVAVNGEIESMDVFESTPLFQKLWPKLLKSYALDASSTGPMEGEAKQATASDARRFLRGIASAKGKREDAKGELTLSRSESDDVLVFTAHERKAAAREGAAAIDIGGMGGMGGGLIGDAVHSAGFSK